MFIKYSCFQHKGANCGRKDLLRVTIYVRCVNKRATLNVFYFYKIMQNIEFHLGILVKGNILSRLWFNPNIVRTYFNHGIVASFPWPCLMPRLWSTKNCRRTKVQDFTIPSRFRWTATLYAYVELSLHQIELLLWRREDSIKAAPVIL